MTTFPVGPSLTVTFDRLLAPSTVHGGSVQVRSGVIGIFGGLRYDPVRRTVTFVPDARAFRRTLQYEFVVNATVRAWDGAPLVSPVNVRFMPGDTVTVPPRDTPSLAREVAPLLSARCATAGCHRPPSPVMGLDLSSTSGILRSTVGVIARQRPLPAPGGDEYTDPAWAALQRIDRGSIAGLGRPEYSYLVYKILGEGPIVGQRMPPEGDALTPTEQTRISDWIAAGAPDN